MGCLGFGNRDGDLLTIDPKQSSLWKIIKNRGQALQQILTGQLGHTIPIGKQFNISERGLENHVVEEWQCILCPNWRTSRNGLRLYMKCVTCPYAVMLLGVLPFGFVGNVLHQGVIADQAHTPGGPSTPEDNALHWRAVVVGCIGTH